MLEIDEQQLERYCWAEKTTMYAILSHCEHREKHCSKTTTIIHDPRRLEAIITTSILSPHHPLFETSRSIPVPRHPPRL